MPEDGYAEPTNDLLPYTAWLKKGHKREGFENKTSHMFGANFLENHLPYTAEILYTYCQDNYLYRY
jgi:hypothetical protein